MTIGNICPPPPHVVVVVVSSSSSHQSPSADIITRFQIKKGHTRFFLEMKVIYVPLRMPLNLRSFSAFVLCFLGLIFMIVASATDHWFFALAEEGLETPSPPAATSPAARRAYYAASSSSTPSPSSLSRQRKYVASSARSLEASTSARRNRLGHRAADQEEPSSSSSLGLSSRGGIHSRRRRHAFMTPSALLPDFFTGHFWSAAPDEKKTPATQKASPLPRETDRHNHQLLGGASMAKGGGVAPWNPAANVRFAHLQRRHIFQTLQDEWGSDSADNVADDGQSTTHDEPVNGGPSSSPPATATDDALMWKSTATVAMGLERLEVTVCQRHLVHNWQLCDVYHVAYSGCRPHDPSARGVTHDLFDSEMQKAFCQRPGLTYAMLALGFSVLACVVAPFAMGMVFIRERGLGVGAALCAFLAVFTVVMESLAYDAVQPVINSLGAEVVLGGGTYLGGRGYSFVLAVMAVIAYLASAAASLSLMIWEDEHSAEPQTTSSHMPPTVAIEMAASVAMNSAGASMAPVSAARPGFVALSSVENRSDAHHDDDDDDDDEDTVNAPVDAARRPATAAIAPPPPLPAAEATSRRRDADAAPPVTATSAAVVEPSATNASLTAAPPAAVAPHHDTTTTTASTMVMAIPADRPHMPHTDAVVTAVPMTLHGDDDDAESF